MKNTDCKELCLCSACEQDTEKLGAALCAVLSAGAFVALWGGLGAGKTAFTRGFVHALGCDDAASPTFTIVHEYDTMPPVFHFDVYRLSDEEELYDIGYEEYLSRGGMILMEWPERTPGALPEDRVDVRIGRLSDHERRIEISGLTNEQALRLQEEWKR